MTAGRESCGIASYAADSDRGSEPESETPRRLSLIIDWRRNLKMAAATVTARCHGHGHRRSRSQCAAAAAAAAPTSRYLELKSLKPLIMTRMLVT
jgi:hypothetical protein